MVVSIADTANSQKITNSEIKGNKGGKMYKIWIPKSIPYNIVISGLLQFENIDEWIFYSDHRIDQPVINDIPVEKRPPSDLIKKRLTFKHDFQPHQQVEVIYEGQAQKAVIKDILPDGSIQLKLSNIVICTSKIQNLAPSGTFIQESNTTYQKNVKFPSIDAAVDLGFEAGQKLMFLYQNREFHTCTILDTRLHFLNIQLDTIDNIKYIISVHDTNIFPVGWPQTKGIEFFVPQSILNKKECNAEVTDIGKSEELPEKPKFQGSWCPPVLLKYLNAVSNLSC